MKISCQHRQSNLEKTMGRKWVENLLALGPKVLQKHDTAHLSGHFSLYFSCISLHWTSWDDCIFPYLRSETIVTMFCRSIINSSPPLFWSTRNLVNIKSCSWWVGCLLQRGIFDFFSFNFWEKKATYCISASVGLLLSKIRGIQMWGVTLHEENGRQYLIK